VNRWDPELVIVSPLRRALQTACLLMERNSTPIQVRAVPNRKGVEEGMTLVSMNRNWLWYGVGG
jgi:phosphohistidine phosphatase SixA